jgi:hypothetical protein
MLRHVGNAPLNFPNVFRNTTNSRRLAAGLESIQAARQRPRSAVILENYNLSYQNQHQSAIRQMSYSIFRPQSGVKNAIFGPAMVASS